MDLAVGNVTFLVENATKLYPGPTIQSRPSATKLSRARRLSCALVAGVDEGVGLLKERLEKADVLEDTVCNRRSPTGCFKATWCPSGDYVLLRQWRGALRRCS